MNQEVTFLITYKIVISSQVVCGSLSNFKVQNNRGEWVSNYFVFTDEAGAYQRYPSDAHIKSHPFYIRSNVLIAIDDYRQYQIDMQRINNEYNIPFGEEIKWSDLWSKTKNKPRNDLIAQIPVNRLKGYYRKTFETAIGKNSTHFMFTVTDNVGRSCDWRSEPLYKSHLQDAFQRVQMDMGENDFATFVMDELNADTIRQIKAACHNFTMQGDFVQYKNLYQGVLIENSLYSPGIQLADYAVGVVNGYLRGRTVNPGKYQFASDLYDSFIKPRLRRHTSGLIIGYGIIDVPKKVPFRSLLKKIFGI